MNANSNYLDKLDEVAAGILLKDDGTTKIFFHKGFFVAKNNEVKKVDDTDLIWYVKDIDELEYILAPIGHLYNSSELFEEPKEHNAEIPN